MKARILFLSLLLFLAACDYIGDENIYGLSESDYQLIADSDNSDIYQFDLDGYVLIEAGGVSKKVDLAGDGAYQEMPDAISPRMNLTLTVSGTDPTGAFVESSIQMRLVEKLYYVRTIDPTLGENTPWVQMPLDDILEMSGLSFPAAGDMVSEELADAVTSTGTDGLYNYTIVLKRAESQVFNGEESAVFDIQLDLKSFFNSDAIRDLIFTSSGLTVPEEYTPEEIDALMSTLVPGISLGVEQYVSLDSGQQNRSVTTLVFDTTQYDPTNHQPLPGTEGQMTILLDTTYRDYGEPVEITAPTNVIVTDTTSTAATPAPPVVELPPPQELGVPNADIQAIITPEEVSGSVCSRQCVQEEVLVTLPRLDQPRVGLDIVFLMDVTTSMTGELSTAKATVGDITLQLTQSTPDLRFAFSTYSDTPTLEGEQAYNLIAPFTTDTTGFLSQVNAAQLQQSPNWDIEESALLALDEVTKLDWRPSVNHLVVILTDAPARNPDYGADFVGGTADDLSYSDIVASLLTQEIHIIGIQSRGSGSARSFLQNLANDTGGIYQALSNADEIPLTVVESVGLLIGGNLSFQPIRANFGISGTDSELLSITPGEFEYPSEGGVIPVTVQICPHAGALPTGDYNLTLDLEDGRHTYGNVEFKVAYSEVCAEVYIPDTPADNGRGCSDLGGVPFWDSPSIIVRRQDDGGVETQFPIAGQENFVYVRVSNAGPEIASSAEIALYASDAVFNNTFPNGWQQIGTQTLSIGVGETVLVGPFLWLPRSENISLVATISTDEDVPNFSNFDVACENNIAQLSRMPMVLDNPSFGTGLLAGSLPVSVTSFLTYRSLDLQVDLPTIDANTVLVALDLQNDVYENWSGQVDGATQFASGHFEVLNGTNQVVLHDLVGGPVVNTNLNLSVTAPEDSEGVVRLSLNAQDRTVTGASIFYNVDDSRLPIMKSKPLSTPLKDRHIISPSVLIPILGAIVLMIVWFILWMRQR